MRWQRRSGHFDQAENQYLSMAEGLLMALEG